jgi:hypothetical protein
VTNYRGGLAGLVEVDDQLMYARIIVKNVDWSLTADTKQSIIVGDANPKQGLGVVHQLSVVRRVDEAEADEIIGRILVVVPWVTPFVTLELSTLGARNINLVSSLGQFPV